MTVDSDVRLRPSTDDDAAALARLAGGDDSRIHALLIASGVASSGGLSLVAEVNGVVAGHLLVAREQEATGHLAIAVDEAFQGRGVGTALIEEAVRWATEAGLARIVLDVAAGNERAQTLYRRLGFSDYGHQDGSVRRMSRSLR
jgi:ribosomal protein S18 acetylase RimI-like enzyme